MRILAVFLLVTPLRISAADEPNPIEVFTHSPSKGGKSLLIIPIIQKIVGDQLNLSCHVNRDDTKYNVFWHVPHMSQNREHRVIRTPGPNSLQLVVENLRDTDNGDYVCEALPIFAENEKERLSLSVKVNIKIRPSCGTGMYQCPNGQCIGRRYLCDGREDCKSGADESSLNCGEAPCINKLHCSDGRCIPFSWCCDKYTDVNCTIKEKLPCCHNMPLYRDFDERGHHMDHKRYHDDGILQTTIYVAVGSAMALLFIVTVLVVAICRIHLKRQSLLNNRCQTSRSSSTSRSHHHHHIQPLYEMCRELHNPANDFQPTPGFLVTYNINNGVQFVGRPVSPPPYTEVVSTPPREGPPPPYISQENLVRAAQQEQQQTSQSEEGDVTDASTPLTTSED
ncbi:low-density lipoprotein receptor class A domain-containing protein 3-like [Neocloeon triangulifer]|uniref:low-density lipoprotein receptor class A domain-containing protein 3-like n=1 Tax=Neocloeon triangulifer TaxID=2078957 RepID=UPI00286F3A6C|nr:low-density lipoprotein receptor class A domain-containing protein 3-like [Neocloeon triangulifer]